ncbi:major strawberry allergen Fra a 1-3-like [Impatiens glandulifera]|uniref:major strawberry allergen Fra a 1-3-like n=1 Tax=Impatiens glandulifera TaxID=253017 RepID=UPI001FB1207B|nr:major strawberry allergen Fra a 1-3-like [Impatiens glandulifera]
MGVICYKHELRGQISPKRMFKALILDSSNLIPKLLPQFIQTIDIIHGDGGPGTIEQVNFTQGSHVGYVRNRIDFLDEENLVCKYTMIEGDPLGVNNLECIAYEVRFESIANNEGCICNITSNYHTLGDLEKIEEEEIKAGKESGVAIFKVIENYLLDNPHL